ncbi:hypothetical protein N9K86_03455 [Litoricolaceae bacterium]|nr:hypothetical protein [Litorivicinaceae bacterium]
MPLKDYQGKEPRQLKFIEWIVAPNKFDKTGKRGTLILKFWSPMLSAPVLCYHDIGSGHIFKQGKNAGVARTEDKIGGGFRLKKGCGVADWMLREQVNINRLREANVGFRKEMERTVWNAPVAKIFNSKKGDYEYRTVLSYLKRGRLPDDIPF